MNETYSQQIGQLLGSVKSTVVVQDMSDKAYHGDTKYLSSSVLKDYLIDPTLAVQRRILKSAAPKEFGKTVQNSMRIGRAAHAWALEGKDKFEDCFPVFKGTKRAGEDWRKFQKIYEGIDPDDILTVPECEKASQVGASAESAIQALYASFDKAGFEVLQKFPEISFFVEYEVQTLSLIHI